MPPINLIMITDVGGEPVPCPTSDIWDERTTALVANDPGEGDYYGWSVALSKDGKVLAVGAPLWDGTAGSNQGTVYVYDWNGSSWNKRTNNPVPSDAGVGDRFGWSVALNHDGAVLAVGAPYWDDATGSNQGIVYVFDWDSSTSEWDQRSAVKAIDAATDDYFGSSCALSGIGSILAVGAQNWEGTDTNQGAVYVFDRNGSSWTERSDIVTASTPNENSSYGDQFGSACALSYEGDVLAVGAQQRTNTSQYEGAMYVYDWEAADEEWYERTTALVPADSGSDDYFGGSCALSYDAQIMVVGAFNWDCDAAQLEGAVYTYEWDWLNSEWDEISSSILTASDAGTGDRFGIGVALSGNATVMAVGARAWDGTETDQGAVYVYDSDVFPDFRALAVKDGVWKALQIAATGTNYYSGRNSIGRFLNSDSYVQEMPEYGIRAEGARTVGNLFWNAVNTPSQIVSGDITTGGTGAVDSISSAVIAASGLLTLADYIWIRYDQRPELINIEQRKYYLRIPVKGTAGEKFRVYLWTEGGDTSLDFVDITASGGWDVVGVGPMTNTNKATHLTVRVAGSNGTANTSGDLDVDWNGVQAEDVTNKSVQDAPSEYVSVGVGVGPELIVSDFGTDLKYSYPVGTNTEELFEDGYKITYGNSNTVGYFYFRSGNNNIADGGLPKNEGKRYVLTFEAKSPSGRVMWSIYGNNRLVDVSVNDTSWTTHKVVFEDDGANLLYLYGWDFAPGEVAQIRTVSLKAADHGAFIDGVEVEATSAHNNSVSSGVVTEGTPSGDISDDIFYLAEPGVTNQCEYGRDVTDTSWTKVSESDPDISYSRNATGIDNLANAASTLSDGDTGIRAEVSASETIPDDSNPYSVVFFVPKDSNSTTFSAAILALTGGTTTLQQTANWKSSDGTSDELFGYGSDGEYAVTADIDGDWWRVTMTIVNNSTGNTTATLYLIPAANTTLGAILSATPTRDMIFDSVMFLENVDFDLAKSLKPILTDGATVLTDDDDVYFDIDNNFANAAYTVIFDWIPSVSQADLPSGSDYGLVTTSNATTGLAYYDDGGIKSVDGSSNETALNLGFVAGKTYRIGCHGTSSSTFQIGAKNITDAGSYSWSTATTFAGFTLGDYIRTFYNQTYPGQIKDLLIFDSDKSSTWIETHY